MKKSNVSAAIQMPITLPEEMRGEFQDLIGHLEQRHGVVRHEDLPLIESLLFHRHAVRMAYEDLRMNGLVIEGKSNPAAAAMAIQTGAVTKMTAALALGPAQRARLKIPATGTPTNQSDNPWGE